MPSKKIQILGSMTSGTVRHDVVQELTEEEKLQARENINAASLDKNGKIPLDQLPDDLGGGEGGTLIQKQADFEQNNSEKVDFIKNRPFYDTRVRSFYSQAKNPHPVSFDNELMNYSFYKISDLVPTRDEIFTTKIMMHNLTLEPKESDILFETSEFVSVSINDGNYGFIFVNTSGVLNFMYSGYPLSIDVPETGIYYVRPLGYDMPKGTDIEILVSGELKTLDIKYLPKNMALGYEDGWSADWDLAPTDTYIQPGFIIEWDGSDTGTSIVIPENEDLGITSDAVFYKVSDNIESLAGCTIVCNTHTEEYEDVVNITPEEVGSFYDTDGNIIGTYAMSSTVVALNIEQAATATIVEGVEVVFPAPGLYFRTDNEYRVFNLYNAIYELFADGKMYKISDSVNTTLSGTRLGIVVDGQTVQEVTIESGGELVLVEQNDGSSAALPYIVNTLADNTTFNLSDLAGFPLVITVPKAGLYMFDIASMFELPEGSSMHLSNTQVVKIDSKFLPNSGCPVHSGGQLMSRESDYLVYNLQALFASLTENSVDFKKGCYDIPAEATEFILSFSGSNLTLDDNLTISIATGHLGGQDLNAYTSDIAVKISGLKSIKSGSWYTVHCVYMKSTNEWGGTVISSTGSDYQLPAATATTLGGIKVGNNLSINNGVLSAIIPSLDWYNITSKPSLYTQSQVDIKLNTKQDTSNLVTSINSSSKDTQYPSAKLLYSTKTNLENLINTIKTTLTTSINTTKSDLETSIAKKVDKVENSRLMTDAEGVKLAGIAENANNYTLPPATTETLGGVKIGENLSISEDGTISATSTVSVSGVVRHDVAQELTGEEKTRARANISAASLDGSGKIPTSQLPDDVVNHKQIQADYAQSDSSKSDYIKNKPTKVSDFSNDTGYQTAQQVANTLASYPTAQQVANTLASYPTAQQVANTLASYPTAQQVANTLASYPTTQQMNTALAGKSDTGHNHNISDLTGVANVERGGTGYASIVDTVYTTARYRASSLHSSETNPSSNGIIAWQYE